MQVRCVVIELKPNSLKRVKEWASYIEQNKHPALESLKNEAVTIENFFFITLENKDFLISYMRAKSFKVASEIVKKSLLEIDAVHKQFKKDTWVNKSEAELVVNLSRITNEDEIA